MRVEAVNRFDQSKACDLYEVLKRLPRAGVASGELPCKWQEPVDELLAGALVAILLPAHEELVGVSSGTHGRLHDRSATQRRSV